MKFSVPFNWQEELLFKIKRDCVDELYGKLAADFMGGGRPSFSIPGISKKKAAILIQKARNNGLSFNYLLNATCLGNEEWTISGQRRLNALLDWLINAGVEMVTVSIPYILQLIKKRYPQLKVCVSTQAGVDTIQRAKYWEELGADQITLPEISLNREFEMLKQIRHNVKCELQLIANLDCLYNCPFWVYHAVLNSHGSQSGHRSRGFLIDYCSIICNFKKINDPVEFIRSGWIRPEDIHYYQDIGINRIKLVNRGMTTEAILRVIDAYTNGYYEGNLLDLFSRPSKNIMFQKVNLFHRFKYFFRPFSVNIFRFMKAKHLISEMDIYIDNRALDGFIEHFLKESCHLKSCADCGYCQEVAREAVKFVPSWRTTIIYKYRDYLNDIISNKMFTYI